MLGRATAVSLVLLLLTGCKLRLSELEGDDPDAAPSTAADAAGVPAASDAAPPDAAPPPADAARPAEALACDEQFGAAAGYVLCGAEPASCSFFVETAGGTCADQCALFASECLDGFDSNPEAPCTSTSADGCLAAHSTQTCICARTDASAIDG